MNDELKTVIHKLVDYCRAEGWSGYDPYDALNSKLFEALPFLNCRIPRLVLTQTLKRSPINLRRLALIPKTENPKAIGLFLSAFVKLSESAPAACGDLIAFMIGRLDALRSPDVPYFCWGYSFPWQGRTVIVPKGAPNLVCTTFVANALLDAHEQQESEQCLSMAVSAAEYMLNELYWTDGEAAGFSYPLPSLNSQIHNANLMAAALLARVYRHTGEDRFLEPAIKVARYTITRQHPDGSWYYGEASSQRWIDNFHTGYNLCALRSLACYTQTSEFDSCARHGFEFYRAHFFREDGAVKYFHNRDYPLDIHSVAQSIITLLTFEDLDPTNRPLAQSIFQWAMNHMWDDRGFFYYRRLRFCTIRTSYMRWSQAWMVLALSALLGESQAVGLARNRVSSGLAKV
jgi:hypothetical protein